MLNFLLDTDEIGSFIKEYRKNNENLTLRGLSDLTGISFSHLGKIERGEHTPTKETLNIIANALGIDKNKLYVKAGYTPDNYGRG